MKKGLLQNGMGVFFLLLLLSSCTMMEPLSDAYEIDEAYWQPGEAFGRPEYVSGSQLAKPQSDDDDFYSEDAARRNSYAPSYLDSTQSNQTDGMVPVWDPVMGWRMVYDPNSVSSSSWGNNSYNSPWSSPFYSGGMGSSMGYGGYGGSNWMLGIGMQSMPYWGNGMYGSYYPYSSFSPYSMYSPYNNYGGYMQYYGGYNPYGWNNGGYYNPYYWNGNSGGFNNGPDQVVSVPRPSTGTLGAGNSNGVIHRRPKSLSNNGIAPTRKQTISDVFTNSTTSPNTNPPKSRPRNDHPEISTPPNKEVPNSRNKPTDKPTRKPQVRPESSRPAPAVSRGNDSKPSSPSRPSGSSSPAPSRSSGSSGSPKSSGKRP
jgi:hypothetical protein